ncbi:MAG TPA: hypothetical protein VHX36_12705 [Candidatus Acidoferrales bacterium]|jgi:hypothetical protein|nr:hypothetical protein [Candidatus Acidoferrales bacterium]
MNETFRVRAIIAPAAMALLCFLPIAAIGQGSPSASNPQPDAAKLAARKTPRLADGHPNLNGIWYRPLLFLGAAEQDGDTLKAVNRPDPAFAAAIAPLPPMYSPSYKPELVAKVKEYNEQQVKLDPGFFCKPPGVPRIGPPHQIVQIPGQVVFLYSDLAGNFWRIIPTDGRPHRTDADPSYFGDAIGHWEGDTLVVDTNNFNDDTWLGDNGLFHSDALHVVERLTRKGDTILYEVTVDDPKVLTHPWTMKPRTLTPLADPLDEAPPCVEKDAPNMVNLEHHSNPR